MYIVDTSFFIQANQVDYPLNKAPTFWRHIQQLGIEGTIVSLDKVQKILQIHDKVLDIWCQDYLPQSFFRSSIRLVHLYEKIVKWAINQHDHYLPVAINNFLSIHEAGAWLVAYSLQYDYTIVTCERNEPEKRHCITMPEVCGAFGIPCIDRARMFEELGLVL